MNSESEANRRAKEIERNTCRVKTYCFVPGSPKVKNQTLEVYKDLSLNQATDEAHKVAISCLVLSVVAPGLI